MYIYYIFALSMCIIYIYIYVLIYVAFTVNLEHIPQLVLVFYYCSIGWGIPCIELLQVKNTYLCLSETLLQEFTVLAGKL